MTTPAPAVPVVTTDKTSYNPGDPITVTVTYADPANPGTVLTITGTVTNADGSTSSGTAQVSVGAVAAAPLPVTVTGTFPDGSAGASFSQTSNEAGTAVFAGIVGTPPAPAPAA